MGYIGGRILRIKVNNFMPYDEMEVFPKKGLNIIIGLNGSGKSTLMCAICLGLNGKPQHTGKSKQLADYIKHGNDKATIEIELEDLEEESVVLKRVIEKDRSIWFLDGRPVSQNQIAETVKKYNIDVSNLCQFLPQEKVADFSKMDKKQRLENMIQAIGEPHLHTLFKELKQDKAALRNMEKEMVKLQSNKNSEVQENERLQVEVAKHNEREKLEEELINKKCQKLFVEYECYRKEVKDKKEELKQMRKDCDLVRRSLDKLRNDTDMKFSEYSGLLNQIKQWEKESSQSLAKFTQLSNSFTELHEEVDCAKVAFQNKIDEKLNQQARLADLERQIAGLEKSVEGNVQLKQQITEEAQNVAREYERIRLNISNLDPDLEHIKLQINQYDYERKSIEESINRALNQQNQQKEFLKQRYRHIYDAVIWLEKNVNTFKSHIILPPILSMKVHRDDDRKFLENSIAERDLKTFVCTDKDDAQRLTNILCGQMKLKVNIGLAPSESIANYQSPNITPEMRQMGIERFLPDLFEAPDPLMCYLCQLSKLHLRPVCNAIAVEKYMDVILQRFNVIFTPSERITSKRSRYGNKNLSMKRDYIRARNIIRGTNEDSSHIQMLRENLQRSEQQVSDLSLQAQNLQKERSVFERAQEQLREKKTVLLEKNKKIENLEMQLKQKNNTYQRKLSEVVNEQEEKEKVTMKIRAINLKRMEIMAEMRKVLQDYLNIKIEKTKRILYAKIIYKKLSAFRTKVHEKQREEEILQRKSELLNVEYAEKKAKAAEALVEIQEKPRHLIDPKYQKLIENGVNLKDILKNKKRTFPDIGLTLEQIEQNIVSIQAQLDLNFENNDVNIIKEFTRRNKLILKYGEEIEEFENRLRELQIVIENKKQQWLPSLEYHIASINKKFSQYYRLLRCAGEISLDKGDDPDDFASYGLQIRLKYRDNEPFSVLSQDHHSGGECNVAAVIFILSLQELTSVPFRCVDEINQGMDSLNERKMYQLIADDASKNGSCSQYFLLTPKLLKNMNYHKDVAVHIIFNSRFLDVKLNVKEHLAIADMS